MSQQQPTGSQSASQRRGSLRESSQQRSSLQDSPQRRGSLHESPHRRDTPPRSSGASAPGGSDLGQEFVVLDEGLLRFRYPAIPELFVFSSPGNRGQRDAKCKKCPATFSYSRVDRMVSHVTQSCPFSDRNAARNFEAQVEAFQKKKQLKQSAKDPKKQMLIEDQLALLIATKSLPLSLVACQTFKDFTKLLNVDFKVPSRNKLTDKIVPSLADKARSRAQNWLREAPDYTLTIEFDGWTSGAGMNIMAILATNLSGCSTVIELTDISDTISTAENLASLAIRSIERNAIEPKKINTIVTDEASNFKLARSLIKLQMSPAGPIEYRCLAHVLNLIGASISKHSAVKPTLDKLIELINIISRHKLVASEIKNMGGIRAVRSIPTRWYSTSHSINSILRLKSILEDLPREDSYSQNKWLPIVSSRHFWNTLNAIESYFNRLSKAIGIVEAEQSKLSDACAELFKFAKFIFIDVTQNTIFNQAAKEAFLKHFAKCDHDLMICAYALDPNHRLKFLTNDGLDLAVEYCTTLLCEMGSSDAIALGAINEFDQYKTIVKNRELPISNVYNWWSSNRLIAMRPVGMRLAACHASSANTERIFSSLNRLITPSRNRLNLSLVYDLLCVKVMEETFRNRLDRIPAPLTTAVRTENVERTDESSPMAGLFQEEEEDQQEEFNPGETDAAVAPLLDNELALQCCSLEEVDDEDELRDMREFQLFFKYVNFESELLNESSQNSGFQDEDHQFRSSAERAKFLLQISRRTD